MLKKIVITTVPFIDWSTPIAAPAYLKAILKENIECVGLDLNIEIYNKIKNHPDRHLYLDFFYNQNIHTKISKGITEMLYHYVKKILEHKPSHVGLSLFSKDSQVFTIWLCHLLKKIQPKIKILIGGPGLETLSTRSKVSFPVKLKKAGLIDNFFVGDASRFIVNYFNGKIKEKSISNPVIANQNLEFHNAVTPDFDDYNFMNYEHLKLPIVDSRGCVQKCEFCDVIEFWKKFQYLSADVVFSQMLDLIKRYSVYRFEFASSISNGNLVEFTKLVKLIANFNSNRIPSQQIFWNGNFIIRKKDRHTDELYKTIKKSNGHLLCGVESLASDVRIKLGKNFNNDDLEFHLEQCKNHDIQIDLLIIASYPRETDDDYNNALEWFTDHKNYANSIITRVQMTLPELLEGTKLSRSTSREEFKLGYNKRREHADRLVEKAKKCGFLVEKYF
jgi:hypothetical protein